MSTQTLLQRLFQIQARLRGAENLKETRFVLVNETRSLAAFRQAVLWEKGSPIPTAISGLAEVNPQAPYTIFLASLLKWLVKNHREPVAIEADQVPPYLADDWAEFMPEQVFWLPSVSASMLLARGETPWRSAEVVTFLELLEYFQLTQERQVPKVGLGTRVQRALTKSRKIQIAIATAIAVALVAFPVPLSILAPAEIVAVNSETLRAPVDGVVAEVLVEPNQRVAAGDLIYRLDPAEVETEIDVTSADLSRYRAEYEQESQRALRDQSARLRLAELIGRIEELEARKLFLQGTLEKMSVVATTSGRVVMDDRQDLIGKPVQIGESVLSIADENNTEIEAFLAASDSIPVEDGADVTLFLDAAPLHSVHGTLKYISFRAQAQPDGTIAHRVRAEYPQDEYSLRLGQRGTLRIDGGNVALGYWILRRPIAVVRGTLGF
jgi:multidrug resistance efflux pump